jgi:hypothetical protein
MHFFRNCTVASWSLLLAPILCSCKIDIPYIHVHKLSAGAPARSILMYFRDILVLRAVLPCTYCHEWHVCLFRLRAATFGAGAKKQLKKKITTFSDAL